MVLGDRVYLFLCLYRDCVYVCLLPYLLRLQQVCYLFHGGHGGRGGAYYGVFLHLHQPQQVYSFNDDHDDGVFYGAYLLILLLQLQQVCEVSAFRDLYRDDHVYHGGVYLLVLQHLPLIKQVCEVSSFRVLYRDDHVYHGDVYLLVLQHLPLLQQVYEVRAFRVLYRDDHVYHGGAYLLVLQHLPLIK